MPNTVVCVKLVKLFVRAIVVTIVCMVVVWHDPPSQMQWSKPLPSPPLLLDMLEWQGPHPIEHWEGPVLQLVWQGPQPHEVWQGANYIPSPMEQFAIDAAGYLIFGAGSMLFLILGS